MNELTKGEMISNLYALRAGLSVVSEIADNVHAEEARIADIRERRIPALYQRTDKSLEEEKESQAMYRAATEEKKYQANEARMSVNEHVKRTEPFVQAKTKLYVLAGICGFLAVLLVFFSLRILSAVDWLRAMIPCLILAVALGICLCVLLDNFLKWNKNKRCLKELEGVISQLTEKYERLSREVAEREGKEAAVFEQMRGKTAQKRREIEAELAQAQGELAAAEARLAAEKEKFPPVYDALHKQFAGFLDERDWQNVDFILFHYETGRALDLRDALLQVDTERRNDRLVAALQSASREVSYQIQRGFGELRQEVELRFNALNDAIYASTCVMQTEALKIAAQNDKIRGQLQALNGIASAQEALQRKISQSSDALVEDMRYLRGVVAGRK